VPTRKCAAELVERPSAADGFAFARVTSFVDAVLTIEAGADCQSFQLTEEMTFGLSELIGKEKGRGASILSQML
jgi:hypothetical protein